MTHGLCAISKQKFSTSLFIEQLLINLYHHSYESALIETRNALEVANNKPSD